MRVGDVQGGHVRVHGGLKVSRERVSVAAGGSSPDRVELSCVSGWVRARIEQVQVMVRKDGLPAPREVARRVVEAALAV